MKKLWTKFVRQVKRVPWYGWVFSVVMVLLDIAAYAGAKAIINGCGWVGTRAICPKIPGIDDAIPLVPYFWIQVYILSLPGWVFGTLFVSVTNKENFINYIIGLLSAYIIGFAIFLGIPTYMNRVAEGVTKACNEGTGFSWWIMRMTIGNDGGSLNLNLLPSFHCLICMYCYLGVCRRKEVSVGLRCFEITFAILVFISTLFTKQHYFIDVPIGILLAIATWFVVKLINPGQRILKKWPNFMVIKLKKNKEMSKKNKIGEK